MSDKRPENQNGDFQLITDRGEALLHLNECLRTEAKCVLWAEGQDQRIHAKFDVHPRSNSKAFSVVMPYEINLIALDHEFEKLAATHLYFSVSLSKANIFFRAPYTGRDDNLLRFENPIKVFKVQRRKNMRFQIRDGYVLRASFIVGGLEFAKKIYDISAGGISFIIDAAEEALFEVGLKMEHLSFDVRGKKIIVIGEVRHRLPLRNRGTFKIGVQFTEITEEHAEHIERFVLDENVRFMARDM